MRRYHVDDFSSLQVWSGSFQAKSMLGFGINKLRMDISFGFCPAGEEEREEFIERREPICVTCIGEHSNPVEDILHPNLLLLVIGSKGGRQISSHMEC